MRELVIIGGGMGDPGLLTARSLAALQGCEEVYAFDRMVDLFIRQYPYIKKCNYEELIPLIAESKANTIGVIVSGDTGFFSMARLIKDKLKNDFHITLSCGISSLQYICSKLGISYEDVKVTSLHGRNKIIAGNLAYNKYTFVLTGSDHNASDILRELKDMGLGSIKVTVGEFLSMEQERLITGTVQELESYNFNNLSVLLFENNHPVKKDRPLFDDELIREKTPMTKQEVRWASINYLSLIPEDIVFDIGAGTGSVSIEMARKAYNGVVYSIERDEEAYTLLNRNREKLFAYNMIPLYGDAMEHLPTLPVPDKAFIGGTGKQMKEILDCLFLLNPDIRLVLNAISLETLSEAMSLLKEHNCKIEVSCINIARNKPAGDYNLMVSNNPVYIITAVRASD